MTKEFLGRSKISARFAVKIGKAVCHDLTVFGVGKCRNDE